MNLKTTSLERPTLLLITGPFASGKTALAKELVEKHGFEKPVTVTTRPPRKDEVDGIHYHFKTGEEFERLAHRGMFLESSVVNEHRYGTIRETIEAPLSRGKSIVICIDPYGVISFKREQAELIQSSLVTIYLEVSLAESIRRAKERPGSILFEDLKRRILTRRIEENLKHHCAYRIKNEGISLDQAVAKVLAAREARRKEWQSLG